MTAADIDQRTIDTIRTLAMDAVQAANSGHPGLPLAMAPAAYLLFARIMEHDPADPQWPDRDRFVLSAGHGSMLLYARCTSSGYDLPLDELKRFRQWGSLTPGHPERDKVHVTPGVEVTTGPLGQGFANGVGMAMAERFLRERYGAEVMDHHTFAICSDGDLMEGISHEAAALAGHLGLGKIVYVYDDNSISLDGPTEWSYSDDVTQRFQAYGWQVARGRRRQRAARARAGHRRRDEGDAAPDARPRPLHHRLALARDGDLRRARQGAGRGERPRHEGALGWDPDEHFVVPDDVREHFDQHARGAALHSEWTCASTPGARRTSRWPRSGTSPGPASRCPSLADALTDIDWGKDKLATRNAGQKAMAAFADSVPTMVGGAADLSESTKTEFPGGDAAALHPREGRPQRVLRACASTAWAARSTAWPPTAASSARTARPSCSSPTTCAGRCACRR